MWDHIINTHPSKLLNTKTKEFIINESQKKKTKKKVPHNNFSKNKHGQFIFILSNIFTNIFKKLTKYKNDYQ